jgi:hypothetical protein
LVPGLSVTTGVAVSSVWFIGSIIYRIGRSFCL